MGCPYTVGMPGLYGFRNAREDIFESIYPRFRQCYFDLNYYENRNEIVTFEELMMKNEYADIQSVLLNIYDKWVRVL